MSHNHKNPTISQMIGQQKSQSKSEVRVMGLDLSLRGTGVCSLEKGVYTATFLPELKLVGAARLLTLRSKLFKIVDAFQPELVMLEGYSYESVGRLFEIGEWGGIVKVGLYRRKIPFEVVPPNRLKKFMGVKRKDKELMIKAVNFRLKFDAGKNDNLADAAALARVAEVYLTGSTKYRSELEVIKDMQTVRILKNNEKFSKCRGTL